MKPDGFVLPVVFLRFALLAVLVTTPACFLFRSPPEEPAPAEGMIKKSNHELPSCLDMMFSDRRSGDQIQIDVRVRNDCHEHKSFQLRPVLKNENGDRIWPDEEMKTWRSMNLPSGKSEYLSLEATANQKILVDGVEYRPKPDSTEP